MRNKILDVNIDFFMTVDDVLDQVGSYVVKDDAKSTLLCTTNPYFIISALKDTEFKDIINNAFLSVPDGVGVLYANYYLKNIANLKHNILFPVKAFLIGLGTATLGYLNRKELGKTITGVELTDKICKLASQKNYTVFFLGGRLRNKKGETLDYNYDMATNAKEIMEKKYPGLNVIGATSKFSREEKDDAKTIAYIKDCMKKAGINKIDFLFVAYNPVDQEKWINRNAQKIPAKMSLGIGRVFDYITNTMQQPPVILEKLHLGWLYAFIYQPWRIRRILMTFPTFPIKVFLKSLK